MKNFFRSSSLSQRIVLSVLAVIVVGLGVYLISSFGDFQSARAAMGERLAEDKIPKTEHFAGVGLWRGALVNLVLVSLLLVTSPWWLQAAPRWTSKVVAQPISKWFWIAVVAAMVFAGISRVERTTMSLDGDEIYGLRHYIMGAYKQGKDGKPEFKEAGWDDALYWNRGADNHIPYTLASRASLAVWRAVAGQGEGRFDEFAMRLPSLLAGVLSIGVIALLLTFLGYSRAGIVAAWLSALHPWHLRYATEAAGYSLALLFIPLVLICVIKALGEGTWKWWLLLGIAQFMLLWSVMGAVWFVLVLNAVLPATLIVYRLSGNGPHLQLRRWFVSVSLFVMLLIQLMAPSLPQIGRYLTVDRVAQPMGMTWVKNAWAHLSIGTSWFGNYAENGLIKTVENLGGLAFWTVALVLPVLVLVGVLRLFAAGKIERIVALAALVPGPLLYIVASSQESFLLMRYVAFCLPGILILVACGIDGLGSALGRATGWKPAGVTLAVVGVVLLAAAAWPQFAVVRGHVKEPLRDVVTKIHGDADPHEITDDQVLRANFWSSGVYYDPWMINSPIRPLLFEMMDKALAKDIPMYVTFGYYARAMTEQEVKNAVRLLEDPNIFEPLGVFPGLEELQFTHYLYRFKGDAAVPFLKPELREEF